jgi:dihydrofolate synthase/folylpolyglutamate synthase
LSDEPLEWLLGLEKLGMKFGLENMATLTRALGTPQDAFSSVVVAGTNGKGSVTAIVETALRLAGYSAARYTSPHLERLEERFVVKGTEIDTGRLCAAVERVRTIVEALVQSGSLPGSPTFFEVTTAVAFDLFRTEGVNIAVLEVGLGGRLDATNVVDPIATAITTIGFDHQAQLGSTIESIAREKAGIIKPRVPVVIGRLPAAAEAIVAATAAGAGAPLVRAHDTVRWSGEIQPALRGAHQVDNAIVALALLESLAGRGFPVDRIHRRRAVEGVDWPGRLELIRHGSTDVLLDAAHNPAGASALASYLGEIGWTDATLVFAAMADKDADGMLQALAPVVRHIICTTAPTPRARDAGSLGRAAAAIAGSDRVETIDDPAAAMARAQARSPRVVVAGSMFLIGPLRGILR